MSWVSWLRRASVNPHIETTPMGCTKTLDGVLLLLLAMSLVLNVAVVWWLVNGRGLAAARQNSPDVEVGSSLQPIVGISPGGAQMAVASGTDERPVVLYVFSPSCAWCNRNLDSIEALYHSVRGRFDFVGILLGAVTPGYRAPYAFPVVRPIGTMPFRATPQTLVVGSNSLVLRSWTGAYVGANRSEIEAYFSTTLPEIQLRSQGGDR